MSGIKGIFSTALSVVIGTVMYILLNWIPVLGPLITGFITGFIARGRAMRRAVAGILSAILGFAILMFFVFSKWGFGNILLLWMILFWNFTGIVFTVMGSILSSMLSTTADFISEFRRFESVIPRAGTKTIRFNICPNCGIRNPENAVYCQSCGIAMIVKDDGR